MARPVTLFTGQWADLPLEVICREGQRVGLRRDRARLLGRPFQRREGARRRRLLPRTRTSCSNVRPRRLGDLRAPGRPGGLRPHRRAPPSDPAARGLGRRRPRGRATRAAEEMKDTARAAAQLGVKQVNGFTGSSIWHLLYSFPPRLRRDDRARLQGLRRALEPDPRRVRRRGREVRAGGPPDRDRLRLRTGRAGAGRRSTTAPEFGFNFDPSHFAWQFVDPVEFALEFPDRIYHVHVKDVDGAPRRAALDPRLAPELRRPPPGLGLPLAGPRPGRLRGDRPRAQPDRLPGPLSIEWEDSGMDRDWGAADALAFVRRTDFAPSEIAFDAAMQKAGR